MYVFIAVCISFSSCTTILLSTSINIILSVFQTKYSSGSTGTRFDSRLCYRKRLQCGCKLWTEGFIPTCSIRAVLSVETTRMTYKARGRSIIEVILVRLIVVATFYRDVYLFFVHVYSIGSP